jgi:hypothetical protein
MELIGSGRLDRRQASTVSGQEGEQGEEEPKSLACNTFATI